ncbi:uncharacterized protein LOC119596991 [Penaeus monodon]|uniref:uncharacterized protein LOC119596991 n=1 Tax=Penaeus monodon TaxID=6687 RepID=UPI0018A7A63F|nr:uncharacterized protein LOC119596991 [Penaeus monodon]
MTRQVLPWGTVLFLLTTSAAVAAAVVLGGDLTPGEYNVAPRSANCTESTMPVKTVNPDSTIGYEWCRMTRWQCHLLCRGRRRRHFLITNSTMCTCSDTAEPGYSV